MSNSIGTLSEKSIHSVLKEYIEPNKEYHEVRVGNYIADIKKDNCIIEIQTQQFKKLIPKLNYYTGAGYMTHVVYPIIENKYINWVDPVSKDILERRKTTHKGVIQDMFKELYWIVNYIDNPLIELDLVLVNAEEYKYLDGYGQYGKKRATKIDKVPTIVNNILQIKSISDLKIFVPSTLKNEFSSKDFCKEAKCNKKWVSSGLKILRDNGIIKIVRKEGNLIIYKRNFE